MTDLNSLISPTSGWTLQEVLAVNDSCQIVGCGTNPSGSIHSFLLTPALAGDANLDGKVDINDLTTVLTNYGQSTAMSWTTGDFNRDGAVDVNDLTIVLARYGQISGADIMAVPEPTSITVLLAGAISLLALAARRRALSSGLPNQG